MRGVLCVLVMALAAPALEAAPVPQAPTARPGSTLVEVVPDLPDFPNAVMVVSTEKGPGDGWAHSWERETRTTAAFADVRAFYLEQITKKGWTIALGKDKPGKAEWTLSKGAATGRVVVDGGSAGLVKITVEWKTR